MFRFLKKDSYILGGILGIAVPGILWLILHFTNLHVKNNFGNSYFSEFMIQILCLVPNVLTLRYYLVSLKADKTGRGILAVTFVIAIVLFILHM